MTSITDHSTAQKNSTTGRTHTPRQPDATPPLQPKPVKAPAALRMTMRTLSTVTPRLAGRLSMQLFFKPFHAKRKPDAEKILATGNPFQLTAHGETIHCASFGTGPIVLLVHGWGGNSGQMTKFIKPLVDAGYSAVVIDMPAHGRSSGRLSSLIHFTDAIDAVVAHHGGDVHAVIAHSFGAAAATIAVKNGIPAKRVAFIAPPASYETFWKRFRDGVGVTDTAFAHMLRYAENWLDVKFADLNVERIAGTMQVPLLVVHDEGDREIDVTDGMTVSLAWPGAQLLRTQGLGHFRILQDNPTVEHIVRFVTA